MGFTKKIRVVVDAWKELKNAAPKMEERVETALTYTTFSYEQWIQIRINNVIKPLNRKNRHRKGVANSAIMLVGEDKAF